jgi:hypothetical protein
VGAPAGTPRDVPAAEAPPAVAGVPLVRAGLRDHGLPPSLAIDAPLVERWLVGFVREELARRGFARASSGSRAASTRR